MPEQQSRRGRSRPSLSDWYSRPQEDDDDNEEPVGACTESSSTVAGSCRVSSGSLISDNHSRHLYSPTKRGRLMEEELSDQSNYFIGDQSRDQSLHRAHPDMDVLVRGLCAVYFENHVSPLLRAVQQTQESLNMQLADIRTQLNKKADVQDVASADSLDELANKVDLGNTLLAQQLQEISAVAEQKIGHNKASSMQRELDALRVDMEQVKSSVECPSLPTASTLSGPETSEVKKLQVLVAAAGVRFDKQIQELRQQVSDVRGKSGFPDAAKENLWPGRVLGVGSVASDAGSDTGSVTASLTGSFTGSMKSFGGEDSVEIKKMRAVVGAAGTVFYRDLRELRKDVHDVREQMAGLKGMMKSK